MKKVSVFSYFVEDAMPNMVNCIWKRFFGGNGLQEKYINYFTKSLINTLRIFIHENFQLNLGKLKHIQKLPRYYNIHVLIGITGDLIGSFILSINKEDALELISAMTGIEQMEHNEITYNILKELSNITASETVSLLTDLNLQIQLAAPIIMKGDNLDIQTVFPFMSIPMDVSNIKFKISLSIAEKKPKNICLVNDDANELFSTKKLLEENGFNVIGLFKSGIEFLNDLKNISPDIVILNINMPEMDGIEVLSHLKIHNPHIKVIMLASMGEARYVQTAAKIGADGYVLKPVNMNLISILRSL